MKTFKILLLCLISFTGLSAQQLSVNSLTVEHKVNPIGMDAAQPRLSWKISASGNNVMQTAYQIRVATNASFASSSIVWNSGKVASDESILQKYAGNELKSGQRYYWQVKVWDNKGRASKWSQTAFWETGLLSPSDWKAQWIEFAEATDRYIPAPFFRKEFDVTKKVSKAVIYATAHGLYELHLNGEKVGDQVFTPGWTTYGHRLQYQVYDVTKQLQKGQNAIGAILGDGWYRGSLAWGDNWGIYGKKLGLFAQMRIDYSDGTSSLIVTDDSWKATNSGPIVKNGIYYGEEYDATKNLEGWSRAGYNDNAWKKVSIGNYDFKLVSSEGAEIRKIEEIKPIKIFKSPSGKLLVDMGQNMVGWIRLKVNGPKGTKVTIRHAEVLDKEGEFYTENLRAAECVLKYTLAGTGEEVYEPRFTFMGFRFIEVDGFPGTLTADNITGVVVHSDMQPTSKYESSDSLINQLQHNIVWGQKGNFLDVPTDCPQRDERLGWTGDAQAFFRTAAFNYNVAAFFTKWMKDLALDQRKGGEVPVVIPDVLNPQGSETAGCSAGWGDVATIIPWELYLVYGDKQLLETQYPSMKAWVEYIRKKSGDSMIWKGGSVYGDWLFFHPLVNNHTSPDGHTEHDFIATAFYAYSTRILANAARVLGKTDDAKTYDELFNKIKKVFIHEYVTSAGRVGTNSQTSYVLSLMFNLLPDDLRAKSAQFLVNDIRSRNTHLSTGFLGTPYLCHVLSDNGFVDVAYDLLLQKTFPSWLYPVTQGATTIWERWDGQRPDGTFQDKGMNSFNHYAYGAIGDWMYRVSAGLDTKSAGYRHLLLKPHPSKKLEFSKATFESAYGTVTSGWERKDGKILVNLVVPPNAKATVILQTDNPSNVTEAGQAISANKNITDIQSENGKMQFEIGSGSYMFEYVE
ncbi:MAG: Bacterial alpha-L-rhamnosidase [Bacteroidetes bacterium ADurb.BinA174]|nr:MAG: Bacterial alpha-L-rhamnosidase [Bacteroidetes bacterium ADurb.BinA174]